MDGIQIIGSECTPSHGEFEQIRACQYCFSFFKQITMTQHIHAQCAELILLAAQIDVAVGKLRHKVLKQSLQDDHLQWIL